MTMIEAIAKAIRETDPHHKAAWGTIAEAKAAIRAIQEAGYVIVPAEPTEEMTEGMSEGFRVFPIKAAAIYTHMLSAAPNPLED